MSVLPDTEALAEKASSLVTTPLKPYLLLVKVAVSAVALLAAGYGGWSLRDWRAQSQLAAKDKLFSDYTTAQVNALNRIGVSSTQAAETSQAALETLRGSNEELTKKYLEATKQKPATRPAGCPASLSYETFDYIEQLRLNANKTALEIKP